MKRARALLDRILLPVPVGALGRNRGAARALEDLDHAPARLANHLVGRGVGRARPVGIDGLQRRQRLAAGLAVAGQHAVAEERVGDLEPHGVDQLLERRVARLGHRRGAVAPVRRHADADQPVDRVCLAERREAGQ